MKWKGLLSGKIKQGRNKVKKCVINMLAVNQKKIHAQWVNQAFP